MSVIITAKNMVMTSANENISGLKIPLRAISIIPPEEIAPKAIPKEATNRIVRRRATCEPKAEMTHHILPPNIPAFFDKNSLKPIISEEEQEFEDRKGEAIRAEGS
jgi:hypothetical protein